MVVYMKDIEKMKNKIFMEMKNGKKGKIIQENIFMVKKMEQVFILGMIIQNIMVNGIIIL